MARPAALAALAAALLAGCPTPEPGTTDTDPGTETGADTGEEPIEPGTETVSATWDVDLFSLYESPTIPQFDTLEGRRKLDGMTISVDHSLEMTVTVENGSAFALAAEDYSHEFYFQSLVQLGIEEGTPPEGEEGPPFFGPGSFLAVQAVDLAADDEVPDSGPDFHEDIVTEDVLFEAHYDRIDTERYLEAMTGTGDLQLVVGGFSESWVYWENDHGGEALLYAGASALQYSGTMTVTYEYSPAEE